MQNKINSKQSGFLQIIIFIILALVVMKFMGITVTGVYHWFLNFFGSVLR